MNAIRKTLRSTLLGLLLAVILGGPLARPAQAQFGFGIVHDPVTLAAHIKEWATNLQQWLQTVDFYRRQVESAVKQVTSLGGILTTVEKQLGYSRRMLQTISDIGRTIRAAYQIKGLLISIVRGSQRFIANIHNRLANGIFDLEKDKQDLRDYLMWELGQVSERTLGDIERLEEYDSTMQMLQLEVTVRKKRIAEAEESAKRTDELLQKMRENPEEVTQLDVQQAQLEADQRNYKAQLARDREELLKIQREQINRSERIGRDVIESRRFGRQIDDLNAGWKKMTEEMNKLRFNPFGERRPAN